MNIETTDALEEIKETNPDLYFKTIQEVSEQRAIDSAKQISVNKRAQSRQAIERVQDKISLEKEVNEELYLEAEIDRLTEEFLTL